MKQGDYNCDQDGSGSETEAGEGLFKALFPREAFRSAAVMRAGCVWVVHFVAWFS